MIRYVRDLPLDSPADIVDLTTAHVRAHLSAVADADDDPHTHASDVMVRVDTIPGECLRVTGALDAEPTAEYLRDDYDPYADCPADLRAEAGR